MSWKIELTGTAKELAASVRAYGSDHIYENDGERAQLANAKGLIVSELNSVPDGTEVSVRARGGTDEAGRRLVVLVRPAIEAGSEQPESAAAAD
jgi:hypothetical protein